MRSHRPLRRPVSAIARSAGSLVTVLATATALVTGTAGAASAGARRQPARGRRRRPQHGPVPGLPAGVADAARRAEPSLPVPQGWPFAESWSRTEGTGRLGGGASYWTDYVYDDHGAAAGPTAPAVAQAQAVSSLAPPDGTYTYPAGPADGNGADIFRAAVGADSAATYWRVDWNTLADPSVPIAEWTLDSDRDAATGTARGRPARVRSPGIDHALVVSGRSARVVDTVTGASTDVTAGLTVDRAARSFVVRVPRSVLPVTAPAGSGSAPASPTPPAPPSPTVPPTQGGRTGRREPLQRLLPQRRPGAAAVRARHERRAGRHHRGHPRGRPGQLLDGGPPGADAGDRRRRRLLARRRLGLPRAPQRHPRAAGHRVQQPLVRDRPRPRAGRHDRRAAGGNDNRPNYLGRVQPYAVYVPTSYRRAPRRRSPGSSTRCRSTTTSTAPRRRGSCRPSARTAGPSARPPRASAPTAGTSTRPSTTSGRCGGSSGWPTRSTRSAP